MVPILEEKAGIAFCKTPPKMNDTVFNNNEDNGFEYELESTLRDHRRCPIIDSEAMYDVEDNKDDPTRHMTSLGVQHEDLYNDRFSAQPGLVLDKDI